MIDCLNLLWKVLIGVLAGNIYAFLPPKQSTLRGRKLRTERIHRHHGLHCNRQGCNEELWTVPQFLCLSSIIIKKSSHVAVSMHFGNIVPVWNSWEHVCPNQEQHFLLEASLLWNSQYLAVLTNKEFFSREILVLYCYLLLPGSYFL